jgi:hypothetical protein
MRPCSQGSCPPSVSPRALAPGTALVPGNSPDNGLSRGKLRPDSIPDEPSSRRRLSAWLQEMLFERRIVLVTGRLDDGLAAEAGQPAEEVAEDQRRGRYLDAREALDYGLIDGIRITR